MDAFQELDREMELSRVRRENAKLQRENERLQALCWRWNIAMEQVTPCGSEYVDEPETCARFIRERYDVADRRIKQQMRAGKETW